MRTELPPTPVNERAVTSPRQAARVSVEKSPSEPGLYLVRLLDEGNAAEAGSVEALLVTLHPNAGLFTL
jgi:hypothetical protein